MNKPGSRQNRRRKSSRLASILRMLPFLMKQRHYFKAVKQLDQVRVTLMRANVELGKMGWNDPGYAANVAAFNCAMIDLSRAKWYATQAARTGDKKYWPQTFACIRSGQKLADRLLECIPARQPAPRVEENGIELTSVGTEIQFAGGAPLMPEICPVVILQGSDYEMGYQYAQQVIQIFGRWVFERKAGRKFSQEELEIIHAWERYLEQYTPEILEMCSGWADGAAAAGVAMSYEDVLEI